MLIFFHKYIITRRRTGSNHQIRSERKITDKEEKNAGYLCKLFVDRRKTDETGCQGARVRYTQKGLKEVLLQLLEQKPVNRITVKEVCERAGLNRTMFYTR